MQPSATVAMDSLAKSLLSRGEDIINLTAGEPDFDTPQHIKDAAIKSILEGRTKYTSVTGLPALREAICRKLKDNKLEYSPGQIIVSCGAKHSIYTALQAVLNPGDEVIMPVPYWTSYPEQVRLASAEPVFANGCTAEEIARKITNKTKLIIINSPNNPSGSIASREELEAIAELAVEKNILVLSDEIYEPFTYGKDHVSLASLGEVKRLTITVNGVSKAYAMTGWRVGYAAAEPEIINAMATIQSHSTGNPANASQYAALAALEGPQDSVKAMRQEFQRRRDYVVQELNSIKGISCPLPEGAFYVFPSIGKDSVKFCEELLQKAKVATVPGAAFGKEGHIRISYAAPMPKLKEAMGRIAGFMQ